MSEIIVEKLRHVYSAGTPFEVAAIEDIDLSIPQGQLVGIIGHTGSGKSTFIQHMNALLSPSAGKVCCGGRSFIMEYLVIIRKDGSELELYIGDDMEKKAVALLDFLKQTHPELAFGKP